MNDGKRELYPDFFPKGCPPIDALHKEMQVYRLVKGDKIDNNDFRSFFEDGLDARSPKFPYIEYGLSVNSDYEELKKYWRGSPALKKKFKNIGIGMTSKNTGVVKPTPSRAQKCHHTWWLYKIAEPEKYFKII